MKPHALYGWTRHRVRMMTDYAGVWRGTQAQALSGQRSAAETANAKRRRSERHVGVEQVQQAAASRARHHAGGSVTAGNQPAGHRGMLFESLIRGKQHLYMNYNN